MKAEDKIIKSAGYSAISDWHARSTKAEKIIVQKIQARRLARA